MTIKKTSILTTQKVFLFVSLVVLFIGFYTNFWGVVKNENFGNFDQYSESLAIGRIARSKTTGVFSDGALPGVNYNAKIVPPEANVWSTVYLKQRPEYIADTIPDSYFLYLSQTGAQLTMYSIVQEVLPFENGTRFKIFHAINALLSALCFTIILGWMYRNFGLVSAIVVLFLITISSWIMYFGNSLWWGLWASYIPFVTMLLVLEYHHKTKRLTPNKILMYLFFAVFAKCLFNGYEFVSTLLVSAMCPIIFYAFLERQQLKSFFIFFIKASCTAVLAVILQMLVLLTQIKIVLGSFDEAFDYIISSYLRRSFSAGDELANQSYVFILKKYLKGNVFYWDCMPRDGSVIFYFAYLILIVVVFGAIVYFLSKKESLYRNRINMALLLTTAVSVIAPLSWLIIFKQHAAAHYHLDYIVWYMPFLLLGFLIIGEGISLILSKTGVYKRNLISEPNL